MRDQSYKQYFRRNLPHIHPLGATLFITFRLAGSIPKALLDEYELKKSCLEQKRFQDELSADKAHLEFHRYWFRTFEEALHTDNFGPTWLGDETVAEVIKESLHHRDNKEYQLDAYCIMPNHVHMVFIANVSEEDLQVYQTKRGV